MKWKAAFACWYSWKEEVRTMLFHCFYFKCQVNWNFVLNKLYYLGYTLYIRFDVCFGLFSSSSHHHGCCISTLTLLASMSGLLMGQWKGKRCLLMEMWSLKHYIDTLTASEHIYTCTQTRTLTHTTNSMLWFKGKTTPSPLSMHQLFFWCYFTTLQRCYYKPLQG